MQFAEFGHPIPEWDSANMLHRALILSHRISPQGVPNQHSSFRPKVRPIVSLRHTFRVHRLAREFP